MNLPPCPMCGHARNSIPQGEPGLFICKRHGLYDNRPDEGGDFHTDPEKNAERKEEFRNRQQARQNRR